MCRQHSLLLSFRSRDPDFYCMTEQQKDPYHVRQTTSLMLHQHQGFHLQIPEVNGKTHILSHHIRKGSLVFQNFHMLLEYTKTVTVVLATQSLTDAFSYLIYNQLLNISIKSFNFNRKEVEVENEIYSLIAKVYTWYATSKNGMWFFSWMRSAIFSHWSGVGSMPVGLWAQPWRSTKDPSEAAWIKTPNLNKSNKHSVLHKVIYKWAVQNTHNVLCKNTHACT